LLLDFDGTLADTRMAVLESVKRTLTQIGFPLPSDESVGQLIARGLTLPETFRIVAPEATAQQIAECVGLYRDAYRELEGDHTAVFEGVQSTLKGLAAAGIRMAVVSNKGTAAVARSLQRFGLERFIDQVFGAEEGYPSKPDPATYDLRIKPRYPDAPKSALLMVGDTAADLLFAKAIGIASCWASYGFGDPTSCRQLNPNFTIQSFPELATVVA
jgi:phosphoglycolate phosphatase